MPQGVEHKTGGRVVMDSKPVNGSEMPQGVEHSNLFRMQDEGDVNAASESEMPQGVEHKATKPTWSVCA